MELTYNELIICPKITEKSNTYLAHQNKFLFKVHKNANKAEIKKAIEKILRNM